MLNLLLVIDLFALALAIIPFPATAPYYPRIIGVLVFIALLLLGFGARLHA